MIQSFQNKNVKTKEIRVLFSFLMGPYWVFIYQIVGPYRVFIYQIVGL